MLTKSSPAPKPFLPAFLDYAELNTLGSWTWVTAVRGFGVVSICVCRKAKA